MKRGREVVDALKKVDCDPRLKMEISEMAYGIYELHKQQAQIVDTMNKLIENYAMMVAGVGNRMNEFSKKINVVDAADEETK